MSALFIKYTYLIRDKVSYQRKKVVCSQEFRIKRSKDGCWINCSCLGSMIFVNILIIFTLE